MLEIKEYHQLKNYYLELLISNKIVIINIFIQKYIIFYNIFKILNKRKAEMNDIAI